MTQDYQHCPDCNQRVFHYGSEGCEDDAGQGWHIAHLEDDNPQISLNMHLADGRSVTVEWIYVGQSHEGWLIGSPKKIWDDCADRITQLCRRTWPAYVIPPVSRRPDIPLLPRWKVQAFLTSTTASSSRDSALMLVFFCNDIASRSITELIRDQVALLDEKTWNEHAGGYGL